MLISANVPLLVVSDGGGGFEKALRRVWPDSEHQRCTFHVLTQIRHATTMRPKLPASKELYLLGKQLLRVKNTDQALAWLANYQAWGQYWSDFLAEKTLTPTGWVYTHERLVRVRNSINELISRGVIFTFCDPAWQKATLEHQTNGIIPKWEDAIAWNELHHRTPYNNTWDYPPPATQFVL